MRRDDNLKCLDSIHVFSLSVENSLEEVMAGKSGSGVFWWGRKGRRDMKYLKVCCAFTVEYLGFKASAIYSIPSWCIFSKFNC